MTLRVTPNASVDRIEGIVLRSESQPALKLKVSAIADKGKANAAVVKLLAKTWGIPRSNLSIVSGDKDRNKTLLVEGDPQECLDVLSDWFVHLKN